MLASIEFGYNNEKALIALGREGLARLREQVDHIGLPEWKEDKEAPEYWYRHDAIIDLNTDGVALVAAGIEFTIKRFKGTYKVDSPDNHQHLHIAIPAIGLLAMDEVQLLSDGCTDALSELLEDGWRIIAVCPPDAQRRPDYILGRSPEMRRPLR
jgi:hypothetical protein